LADKNSECDSLQYRLKHYEEITNMMDASPQGSAGALTGGAVPNPTEEDKIQVRASGTSFDN